MIFRAVLILSLFVGCAGDPAARKETPRYSSVEASLVETFELMTRLIEEENSFRFMEMVSDFYSPSRFGLKADVDEGYQRYSAHIYHNEIEQVNVDGDEGLVVVNWRLSRNDRTTNSFKVITGTTELRFERDGAEWKLAAQNGEPMFGNTSEVFE